MPEVSRTFSIRPGIEASSRDRVGPLGGDAAGRPGAWVLIGGQMVLLHGLEYDELPVRETVDADLLVNVRALPRGTERLANALQRRGLTIAGMSPDGVGHRFSGGGFNVDVLAADNLGHRANLTTVRPARTLGAPAGTRLVRAPRRCPAATGGAIRHVPRPDLDAAIVGKAAALGLPADSQRHGEDLAFLCGLVEDPSAIADTLNRSDRRHLERARPLLKDNRVWTYTAHRDAARATLRYLLR